MTTKPKLIVVEVEALSYSGTTWLNLVLGTHPDGFTLGPPLHAWGLRDQGFEGANLVWGSQDTFWKGFDRFWDRDENFLLALGRYRGASHIFFDNPPAEFRREVMTHPEIQIKKIRYLRDARAITASFARKNPDRAYLETILPSGWFYHSFMGVVLPKSPAAGRVFYYENSLDNPLSFLKEAGAYIGLDYDESALRFWEGDHHITSGNQGTISLVKMAKGLSVGSFRDRTFYSERLEALRKDPITGFRDERWRSQLSRLDLLLFDTVLGAKNAELGYARDTFSPSEIEDLKHQYEVELAAGRTVALPSTFRFGHDESSSEYKRASGAQQYRLLSAKRLFKFASSRSRQWRGAASRRLSPSWRTSQAKLKKIVSDKLAEPLLNHLKRWRRQTAKPEVVEPMAPVQDAAVAATPTTLPGEGTHYYDDITSEMRACITPYSVTPSKATLKDVGYYIHSNVFVAYGPDYSKARQPRIVCEPLHRYRELLESALKIPGVRFATARDMIGVKPPPNEIICHVRHDVDIDIVGALEQARVEASLGIQSTFYILHTAPYYGNWDGKSFRRHEATLEIYKAIQALGHEVALHSDGLGLYQFQRTDGAQGLKTELEWMRTNGLDVTGSVTHNSFPIYGAENFAIFKGRPLGKSKEGGPVAVIHNGNLALLRQLDEKELGLYYEGNDFFTQTDVPIQYYALRTQNDWRYQVYNRPQIQSTDDIYGNAWMSQDEVIDHLARADKGCYAMFIVHPVYYGMRRNMETGPVVATHDPATPVASNYGWRTLPPGAMSLRHTVIGDRTEAQSVVVASDLGMADVPAPFIAETDKKLVVIGKDNIASDAICVGSKLTQSVARIYDRRKHPKVGATSVAGQLAPLSARLGWYTKMREVLKPDFLLLSVGLTDLVLETPEGLEAVWHVSAADAALLAVTPHNGTAGASARRVKAPAASQPNTAAAALKLKTALESTGQDPARHAAWPRVTESIGAALATLRHQGLEVALLLEDCGEPLGLGTVDADGRFDAPWRAATSRAFADLAAALGVPLVDPYPAFAAYAGLNRTHLRATGAWSIHGHTLAGHEVVRWIDANLKSDAV